MSDLLNKASLVMVPSGYKEDIVYSVLPTDGSGDLSFTRASNGTRVNSAGLVEVVPWNYKSYSEDLTSGAGLQSSTISTITANTTDTTDPFGTNKAEKFDGTSGQVADTYNSIPENSVMTSSIYAKAGSVSTFILRMSAAFGTNAQATFNLSSGTITATSGDVYLNSTITPVGNGWYRCSITYNFNTIPTNRILLNANGSLYFFGWQLNIGSTAKPYFPTTDRLNVPRLTYQNGGGGCPSLLLEKQSTNINTYSEDFSNAVYTKENSTIATNQTISPDGTQNADKLTDDGFNLYHIVYPSSLTITTSRVSSSVYVKNNDIQFCAFQLATSIGGTYNTRFTLIVDLINGTITDTEQVGTPNAVYSIENVGNGWYRLNLTCDHSAGSVAWVVGGSNSGTPSTFVAALPSYIGTGKSLFIWGAQIEASSYPTSYIPTTSSSATRVADACFKTGISSLFGTNQGTFFIDLLYLNSVISDYLFDVTDSSNTNRFLMYDSNGSGLFWLYDSISSVIAAYQLTNGQRYKIAVKYNSTAAYWYINGVLVATGSNGFAYQMSQIYLGQRYSLTNQIQIQVNETIVFPTALSGTELISLTTI